MFVKNFWLRVFVVVCLLIVLVSSSPVFAAKWYEYYEAAEKAIENEEWETAIDELQKAIKEEPNPGEHKRPYGTIFIDYYPYLKLGEAYLAVENLEAANYYCQEAQKKGVAPKKLVKHCLEQVALGKKGLQIVKDNSQSIDSPFILPDETDSEPLPPGDVYAVIIGIGEYQDERIPDLRYTVNDAQGLYDVLTDPDYGGVPQEHIKLLLDQEATYLNIKEAIGSWLSRQTKKQDRVLIYYSGHGAPEGAETYWVTYNANIDNLYMTALSNKEIYDMLDRIESKRLITFLDSCYSAATVNRTDRTKNLQTEIPWEKFSGTGRVIISASDGKQLSLELEKYQHGVFTHYLLEGLKGEADTNRDGVVVVDEIWDYVKYQVTKTARKAGNPQTPVLQGKVTAGIPLTLSKSTTKTGQEKLSKLLEQGIIRQEQYDCALKILNSGQSNPFIEGLISEEISEKFFGQIFTCD